MKNLKKKCYCVVCGSLCSIRQHTERRHREGTSRGNSSEKIISSRNNKGNAQNAFAPCSFLPHSQRVCVCVCVWQCVCHCVCLHFASLTGNFRRLCTRHPLVIDCNMSVSQCVSSSLLLLLYFCWCCCCWCCRCCLAIIFLTL